MSEPTSLKEILEELIEAIDESHAFVDLEAGQGGYGPVVQACEAIGKEIPPNLAMWLSEEDDT